MLGLRPRGLTCIPATERSCLETELPHTLEVFDVMVQVIQVIAEALTQTRSQTPSEILRLGETFCKKVLGLEECFHFAVV